MRFSAEWHDPGVSSSAELRATFCMLEIQVGGKPVSRFFDSRRDRVHARIAMPAYPLAQGLAKSWWYLMTGRSGSLILRRFRDGFAVPDVRFHPDGRYVEIRATPFEYQNPPVTFPLAAHERVPVEEVERDAADFIEAVLEHLDANRVDQTWLADRWARIQSSMEDEAERVFCEAAGALRLDPYACDDAEAGLIEAAATYFEADALSEFLAGQSVDGIPAATAWISAAEHATGEKARLPDLAEIGRSVREGLGRDALPAYPWEHGYAAARACRAQLGISAERTFADLPEVAALFGRQGFEPAPGRVPGIRAEALNEGDAPKIIVAAMKAPTSRTFAMMRAIGDFIAFGDAGRAPITDTYSYRQGVGRAFAIEMLAPAEIILDMERDGMTAEEIGAERHVSEVAVTHHLDNHRERRLAA